MSSSFNYFLIYHKCSQYVFTRYICNDSANASQINEAVLKILNNSETTYEEKKKAYYQVLMESNPQLQVLDKPEGAPLRETYDNLFKMMVDNMPAPARKPSNDKKQKITDNQNIKPIPANNSVSKASSILDKKKISKEHDVSKIKSPHGFFSVNDEAVTQIRNTNQIFEDGFYKTEYFVIKSIYTQLHKGEMITSGWWSPSSQQFYTQNLSKALNGSKCEWWLDANWGYSYKPVSLNISGKIVNAYKQSNSYNKDQKPQRICENYKFYSKSCKRVSCNKWEDPKVNNYLIRSRNDALNYFDQITNQ